MAWTAEPAASKPHDDTAPDHDGTTDTRVRRVVALEGHTDDLVAARPRAKAISVADTSNETTRATVIAELYAVASATPAVRSGSAAWHCQSWGAPATLAVRSG
jgi:hypothetical protein